MKDRFETLHRQFEESDHSKGEGGQLFEVVRFSGQSLISTFRVQIYLGLLEKSAICWYWKGDEWTNCHEIFLFGLQEMEKDGALTIERVRKNLLTTAVNIVHARMPSGDALE